MTDFSYQLYSSRNFGPLGDTLRMVADLGYTQVEGYGGLYIDEEAVAALKAGLAETGLTMPTGHFSLAQVEGDPAGTVAIALALDAKAVMVPHIGPEDRASDAAGWRAFGKRLAKAGQPFWDVGMAFGWHNHDFEFQALPDGEIPLELILAGDDRLALELDVAWCVVAGQEPLDWIAGYKNRLIASHIKDIAPKGEATDEDGWADVGHGTMDWSGLMTALRATKCQYFVMEHDNPSDDKRFATRSIASAKTF